MKVRSFHPFLRYLHQLGQDDRLEHLTDAQLLQRFALKHEEAAFTALVCRHGGTVLRVCQRVLRDSHEAEDAFQAAFLLLAQKASHLRAPGSVGSWLYGVAYRTALKARRLAAKRRSREQHLETNFHPESRQDNHATEVWSVLDEAIHQLPGKYRRLVVLCYLQGKTHSQVARELGVPRGTIATRLVHARRLLHSLLRRRGVELSSVSLTALLLQVPSSAQVSPLLAQNITRLALTWDTAGMNGTHSIPAQVIRLMKGVSQAMLMDKLKFFGALLLAGLLLTALGLCYHSQAASQPPTPPSAATPPFTPPPPGKQKAPAPNHSNFIVKGTTPEIANIVATFAEEHRKKLALAWLGKELPPWKKPCPIQINVRMGEPSGATAFQFHEGEVVEQNMELAGPLDQLLVVSLPHEITHTILAHTLRKPVPRWADEGASVLSEDQASQKKHDDLVRTILKTPGRAIPLRHLLPLHEYPRDVPVLFAQGYSVTKFLAEKKNKKSFLTFLKEADQNGWNKALQKQYGYTSADDLEKAWLAWLQVDLKKISFQPDQGILPPPVLNVPPPMLAPPANVPILPASESPLNILEAQPLATKAWLDKQGKIIIELPKPITTYVQKKITAKDGGEMFVYIPQTAFRVQTQSFAKEKVQAFTVEGKPITPKKLMDLLQKETPVLVSQNGKPPGPFQQQFFKKNAIVLVVPPEFFFQNPPTAPAPALVPSS